MIDARYQILAEAAFEGVAVIDGLEIIDANEQLAEMLGYASRDELIGLTIGALLPHDDVATVRDQIQESVATDLTTLEQQRCIRRDGAEIIAELRGKRLHETKGDVSILVFRDVTAWKKAEVDLERAYADLEQFTHIASHDLRAPLRGLDNLSQWILEDLGDDVPEASRRWTCCVETTATRRCPARTSSFWT